MSETPRVDALQSEFNAEWKREILPEQQATQLAADHTDRAMTLARELERLTAQTGQPSPAECVVTSEMIAAGKTRWFEDRSYSVPLDSLFDRVFQAMLAAAPKPAEQGDAHQAGGSGEQ